MSLAVTVGVPTALSVTLNCFVPEESAAFAGRVALVPDEVIPTVSVAVETMVQEASTACTVTVNGVPADRAVGVPVFPLPLLAVPGAAVSPGTRSCSFVNAPRFTVIGGLVLAVLFVSVMSLAVTVGVPTALSVTLNVFVPEESAAFAGRVALVPDEVIPTVSVGAEVITFQAASTAFTVTVNTTPAARAVGVPVFPLGVPAAAVSPGTKSCSFVNT